jgi:ThiF family
MDWIESHIKTLTALSGMGDETARKLFLQPVRVELAPELWQNATYRLAYVVAVNLVARIFPRVDFQPGDFPSAITPWGRFEPIYKNDECAQVILRIGGGANAAKEIGLVLHKWRVAINPTCPADPTEVWNPLLAIVGACYAVSAITNKLLNGAITGAKVWPEFSILDFESGDADFDFSAQIEFGRVHVAGIGAVGSAFLFCLGAHGKLQGRLHLIDKDVIDTTNLGRYPLFDTSDIGNGKVHAARAKLASISRIDCVAHLDEFESYCRHQLKGNPGFRIERLVSAPDKRKTRRSFQHELPWQLWDASTGTDQVVIHSNHYDPNFACLECIYPERPEEGAHLRHLSETLAVPLEELRLQTTISPENAARITLKYPHLNIEQLVGRDYDSIFRDLCSASMLRAGDEIVLAPMSFTSMLAGAFLYLEFLKSLSRESFAHLEPVNYYVLNPLFPPNRYLREMRGSRPTCTCQTSVYRRAFSRIWGSDSAI